MIKEYTLNDGSKRYLFKAYLGIDETTGKKKYTTRRGFKTRKEANTALARLKVEVEENGIATKQKKYKFEEVYDMWFEQHKLSIKESSIELIKGYFKNMILPKLQGKYIDKITYHSLQKIINEWSNSYRTELPYTYTKLVFKYAMRVEIITSNPFDKVVKPKKKDKLYDEKKDNFYTLEELKQFLSIVRDNYDEQYYVMFHLLAYTGMRKGELLALQWTDFNEFSKTITINKTVAMGHKGQIIQSPKTKSSNRQISLDDITVKLLVKWRISQIERLLLKGKPRNDDSEQLIFSNRNNKLVNRADLNLFVKDFFNTHDLKYISPHGFRHTHASLLFESGATIKQVQDRLGHTDIKTTMNIYTHVTEKQKDETAMNFAKYLGNF